MSKMAQIAQIGPASSMPGESKRVNEIVVWMLVNSSVATAKARATTSRPNIFARLDRPRLRSRLTLIQSSMAPTAPAPTIVATTIRPVRVKTSPERTWAAP